MNASAGVLAAIRDPRLLWWLAATLIMLVVLGLVWWSLHRKAPSKAEDEDRIDTLIGWPPSPTRLLTNPERVAFGTLVRALPEYMVLSQVPLSRFITVPKRNSYAEWLRRLGNQCIDFLICDMSSQIIAVVEVQPPPAQTTDRARRRQARIARTLKAARVPLHVWFETSLPAAEVARDTLLARPEAPAPASGTKPSPAPPEPAPTAQSRSGAPVPAFNPFEDTGRDSTQDELIEAQEPPPSTWYDDFDSGPTPLSSGKHSGR